MTEPGQWLASSSVTVTSSPTTWLCPTSSGRIQCVGTCGRAGVRTGGNGTGRNGTGRKGTGRTFRRWCSRRAVSGEQYSGRLQVLDSPTVWSECMCDRKNSRAPPARRTLQKSTAMGVPGITVPFMAPGRGERSDEGGTAAASRRIWRATPRTRGSGGERREGEGRRGACAVGRGAERSRGPCDHAVPGRRGGAARFATRAEQPARAGGAAAVPRRRAASHPVRGGAARGGGREGVSRGPGPADGRAVSAAGS